MRPRTAVLVVSLAALVAGAACEKMPLLAPTGTVITLLPSATFVPVNGEIEITATLIEQGAAPAPPANGGGTGTTTTGTPGAGTPVHNGTLVTFTSSIGRIEPQEARTHNGQVRVRFIAGGQSGMATITAFSGGASARIENLPVGAAAAHRIDMSATPQNLGSAGGVAQITARVVDTAGNGLAGVPVTFTADQGVLSATSATADATGVARTSLTTTRAAVVTARAGEREATLNIGLAERTGISIQGPQTPPSAGQPAVFTVTVGGTANVQNVLVEFGDGRSVNLGRLTGSTTISHTYLNAGTYEVAATAVDASGDRETVRTSVTVLPAQPPGVTITASNNRPNVGQIITLTANVSGATSTIQEFQWDFGDGTPIQTTTGPQVTKSYASSGTRVVRVTVIQATGPAGTGQTTIDVIP